MPDIDDAPVFDDAVCSECEEPLPIGHHGDLCDDCAGDMSERDDEVEETCD